VAQPSREGSGCRRSLGAGQFCASILGSAGRYPFEHNFGHGNQHLAAFLLTLNLLAFLFHTVLGLVDAKYKLLRTELRVSQNLLR